MLLFSSMIRILPRFNAPSYFIPKNVLFDTLYSLPALYIYEPYQHKYFSTSNENLYSLLGVAKNATADDIKKAYKKLALIHHPDRNPNNRQEAEERFRKISEAYQTLSDSEKRKMYDRFGSSDANYHPQYGKPSSMNNQSRDYNMHHMSAKEAEELFKNLFGGMGIFDLMNQAHSTRVKSRKESPDNIQSILEQMLSTQDNTKFRTPYKRENIFNANFGKYSPRHENVGVISSSSHTSILQKNGRLIERQVTILKYSNGQTTENIYERDITPSSDSYEKTSHGAYDGHNQFKSSKENLYSSDGAYNQSKVFHEIIENIKKGVKSESFKRGLIKSLLFPLVNQILTIIPRILLIVVKRISKR